MSRVAQLRARREALLLRSATLRMQLVMHGDELEHAAVRVDRGISFARMLTAKPVVLLAGAGLLLSIGPGRVFRWISRGLVLTSVARRAYGILALTHRRG